MPLDVGQYQSRFEYECDGIPAADGTSSHLWGTTNNAVRDFLSLGRPFAAPATVSGDHGEQDQRPKSRKRVANFDFPEGQKMLTYQ